MIRRTDSNQKDIVKAFRDLGASVLVLSHVGQGCPDLLVGIRGNNYLIEVKDGNKPNSQQKLTHLEELFFLSWKGNAHIVRSLEDVIKLINYGNDNSLQSKEHDKHGTSQ